jgi:hypothetical protein
MERYYRSSARRSSVSRAAAGAQRAQCKNLSAPAPGSQPGGTWILWYPCIALQYWISASIAHTSIASIAAFCITAIQPLGKYPKYPKSEVSMYHPGSQQQHAAATSLSFLLRFLMVPQPASQFSIST